MAKRRNIQLELAFGTEARGEALSAAPEGTEARAARTEPERPAAEFGPCMETVVERDNLRKALKQVQRNKGAPGIDGMTVAVLPAHLKDHWPEIRVQLLNGTYKPQPVRRVEIPKASGGVRLLGIPTVLDRFIQQAVMQVLQADWDPTFSEASYGFRPGRSAHQAVKRAQEHIQAGFNVVVDLDLEKFFDRVNHDTLMGLVAKRVSDKAMLKLIRGFLTAGVLEGGLVSPTDEGTPQGGPLSPLLSNLMLDELDKELERRGHRFVRYADDCNIYVRSHRAGERVMATVTQFLKSRLKLKVNTAKSAVARPSQRSFLSFSFMIGPPAKRRIAPHAVLRFKARVRELTRCTKGASLTQIIEALSRYLLGWRGYFGFCETPTVLQALDQWIRRRLRAIVWRQWKRGSTRFAQLRRRDVGKGLAAKTAGSAHGPWRLSHSPALAVALPNHYLRSLGLASVAPTPAA
jgi:RNA-directed DNA polymerase